MGSVLTKAESCAGGACTAQAPATQDCAPYACTAGACQTSCTQDAQCATGNYCSAGTCVPQSSQGTACTAGDQCRSGFCAGGLCCDKACTGQCKACSAALTGGTDGTCADVTAGTPDPSGACAVEAPTSCGTDGNCAAGGTCEDYASGTACGTTCSGSQITVRTCDGTGVCNGTAAACPGNFRCASGTACGTTCAPGQNQCASGFYCDAGMCVTSNAGAACASNSDCSSLLCLGGFCCVTNQCNKMGGGPGNCGGNACEAGTGACNAAPALTSCGPTSCVTSTEARDYVCDGMGACQQVQIMCPTTCTSGKCATCVADADCSQYGWCDAGACMPKGQSGATCAAANQCLSGVCTTGKCQ